MPSDWLLRIGNGVHFERSKSKRVWGVNSADKTNVGYFLKNVAAGDHLWFVKSGEKGRIVAVATFQTSNPRVLGPLIALSYTNEELGWTESDGAWDTELHYTDLYDLSKCDMFSEIKSPKVIRLYNEKCKVNLPNEYPFIVKYSSATKL